MNTANGTATIEFVIGVCHRIFNDITDAYKKTTKIDEEFCDNLHSDIIKKYKDFSSVYPIVLRHMVYEQKFYPDVMKKFLLHVSNHPVKNREDSLAVQAEYLVYSMRHENKRCDVNRIYEYRNYVLKELQDNDKKLELCIKEATEEMKRDKEVGQLDRRSRLREYLLKQLGES
jgi:hypothetical protein